MSFDSDGYQNLNRIRLEHLDSLQLSIPETANVLELGAGVGDLTGYWLERCQKVTCVEGRKENSDQIVEKYATVEVIRSNLDGLSVFPESYDVVFAYGILYHLLYPYRALKRWAMVCRELLLIETVISKGRTDYINVEDSSDPTAGMSGTAVWPYYPNLLSWLKEMFQCVYAPARPPDYEEYTTPSQEAKGLVRRVLLASRSGLDYNSNLVRL